MSIIPKNSLGSTTSMFSNTSSFYSELKKEAQFIDLIVAVIP